MRGKVGSTDLSPYLAQRMFIVLLQNDRKMIKSRLQVTLRAFNFSQFVVSVDLILVYLNGFGQMFERFRLLATL